jgi:hypothetical protein
VGQHQETEEFRKEKRQRAPLYYLYCLKHALAVKEIKCLRRAYDELKATIDGLIERGGEGSDSNVLERLITQGPEVLRELTEEEFTAPLLSDGRLCNEGEGEFFFHQCKTDYWDLRLNRQFAYPAERARESAEPAEPTVDIDANRWQGSTEAVPIRPAAEADEETEQRAVVRVQSERSQAAEWRKHLNEVEEEVTVLKSKRSLAKKHLDAAVDQGDKELEEKLQWVDTERKRLRYEEAERDEQLRRHQQGYQNWKRHKERRLDALSDEEDLCRREAGRATVRSEVGKVNLRPGKTSGEPSAVVPKAREGQSVFSEGQWWTLAEFEQYLAGSKAAAEFLADLKGSGASSSGSTRDQRRAESSEIQPVKKKRQRFQ